MDRKQFGKNLTAILKVRNVSNRNLSDSCGIPYSTVVSIEYGQSDISQSQLEAIADYLGISPLELLGIDLPEPSIPIEARLRVQGYTNDPEIKKALEFASNFLTHIEELKHLRG
ncbi:helix-turn-helix domain-containing protein [Paenibacillus thalictri]|uniref:XRE family transcriptional regulator n=1 Tax=Paenibacillus thalictri TaxID=2527873 RepID=A0A4Q9DFV7_9BACL|nr:helix-turn-helix transcriptional regulator [Paenibacillus thalictri]TBL70894.1 XRE family transcriptional regulator [Paenibacillus thalictri]